MNGKVSKLLHDFSRVSGISEKVIKKDYKRTPWNKRNDLLKYWAHLTKAKLAHNRQGVEVNKNG